MKKIISIAAVLLVVCLLVPVSCGRAPVEESPGMLPPGVEESMSLWDDGDESYEVGKDAVNSGAGERMIIRTGDVSLIVADVVAARDEIALLAESFGGYVVSSRIWGEEDDRTGQINIRVPDGDFDDVMAELRELAVRVDSESSDSQDVTEEYTDLESRLRNAEATEAQYLALLDKAEDVEDILKIYNSLSQVRSEIEYIKGRMQYLERTTSMSLISVRLEPEATAKPLVRVGWNAWEIVKSAVRGIVVFAQFLLGAVIWLLIFSPVWGAIIGIIYWLRRRRKQRQA